MPGNSLERKGYSIFIEAFYFTQHLTSARGKNLPVKINYMYEWTCKM